MSTKRTPPINPATPSGSSNNSNQNKRYRSSSAGSVSPGASPGPLTLEAVMKRDDFYSCYLRKRDLKLQHLGMNSTRRFYVNENLAVPARKIKKAALELKKSGKLSSVYSKKGIVHVKRTADQQPGTAVHSENQLQQYS